MKPGASARDAARAGLYLALLGAVVLPEAAELLQPGSWLAGRAFGLAWLLLVALAAIAAIEVLVRRTVGASREAHTDPLGGRTPNPMAGSSGR